MISIIIPTYQPQAYLWQCLDSFAVQTLDKSQWELVIVLNGCDEPWLQQLKTYQYKHSNLSMQIIQTDEAGVSNARNLGLDHARGEYIGFVDDDDYVSPSYLEELISLATPDTIAAAYSIAFDETHDFIPYYIEDAYRKYAPKGNLPYYAARTYFSGPCMKLIHRDVIGDRRFDSRFALGEDSLFMFLISNHMRRVAFTSQHAVYYRRMRQNSASHQLTTHQHIQNAVQLLHQYSRIFVHGKDYSFSFYITRILGLIHSIIAHKQ